MFPLRRKFHEVRVLFLLEVAIALLSMFVGCANPTTSSPSSATTGEISGSALYSGQTNNSGITITADSTTDGKTATVLRMLGKSTGTAKALAAQATTNSAGAYTLTNLAAGTYTVYASSPNSLEKAVTTSVVVTAGKTVSASTLNLTPTGSITGKATINGATSGNLGIVVYIAGTSYAAMTDDTGAYTITSVPAQTTAYTLVASLANYSNVTTTVTVTAGTNATATALTLGVTPDLFFALTLQTSSSNTGLTVPGCWQNGKVTLLPTTTKYPNGGENNLSVIGTDIYIGGYLQNGTTTNTQIPVYWKINSSGSTLTTLPIPSGSTYGQAKQFSLDSSGNLYVSGVVYSTSNVPQPGYWINGIWQALSLNLSNGDGTATGGDASGAFGTTSSGALAFGGWLSDSKTNTNVPVVWSNITTTAPAGTVTVLSTSTISGATGGYVDCITSNSTSTYYTGSVNNSSGNSTPVYWLNNGAAVALPLDGLATNGQTWGPDFIGSDLYSMGMIWGNTNTSLIYWKNWQLQTLPVPSGVSGGLANWAYQVGSDIYIDGTLNTANGLNIPVYWKNGKINILDIGATYVGASQNMAILSF
jgi:hypothetical protein